MTVDLSRADRRAASAAVLQLRTARMSIPEAFQPNRAVSRRRLDICINWAQ
jgi:hypothetical protein